MVNLAGLWICGVCFASSELALQVPASENLRTVVVHIANLFQFFSAYVDPFDPVPLACSFVASAGFSFFAVDLYRHDEQKMAKAVLVCIVLVLVEGFWNNLSLNLLERFFVALPLAIAGAFTAAELLSPFRRRDNIERSQAK